jgi:HSP20 family protein
MNEQNTTTPQGSTAAANCECDPCECGPACECATETSAAVFRPGVDVIETSHEYLIHADVPGATPEGIDIQLHEGTLRLKAAVPQRQKAQSRVLVREYGTGDYERSFRINGHVDTEHISAELRQGVLTLRLPKTDAVKPRKISVQSQN